MPIRSLGTLSVLARLLLPVITFLPQSWLYPTGKKQEEIVARFPRFYERADIICGDFKYIRRHLIENLSGKIIVTNTTMPSDVELLRERGLELLVTTTMDITLAGRSPGTNVLEAVLIALLGKRPEETNPDDYADILARLEWAPRVVRLRGSD